MDKIVIATIILMVAFASIIAFVMICCNFFIFKCGYNVYGKNSCTFLSDVLHDKYFDKYDIKKEFYNYHGKNNIFQSITIFLLGLLFSGLIPTFFEPPNLLFVHYIYFFMSACLIISVVNIFVNSKLYKKYCIPICDSFPKYVHRNTKLNNKLEILDVSIIRKTDSVEIPQSKLIRKLLPKLGNIHVNYSFNKYFNLMGLLSFALFGLEKTQLSNCKIFVNNNEVTFDAFVKSINAYIINSLHKK